MILANGCPKSGTHALMAWLAMMGMKRIPGLVDGRRGRLEAELRPTEAYPDTVSLNKASERPHRYFCHSHVPSDCRIPDRLKVINIVRDPRNVLVSHARFRCVDGDIKGCCLAALLREGFGKRPFMEVYRSFLGWEKRGAAVVRYEQLSRDFLAGAPGLYAGAMCDQSTLNKRPTDWREHWTDDLEAAWSRLGGEALLRDAGYR